MAGVLPVVVEQGVGPAPEFVRRLAVPGAGAAVAGAAVGGGWAAGATGRRRRA
ncbi:hypothetical protein [Streptomyces sp. NPDC048584]|uniref:hypothetical protein n=1 Tax=Streptomyces sp. NPDC048584 TaxID=3365573 RepID=UPI003716490E